MSVLSRLLSRGDADEQSSIEPLRRRHLADILASSRCRTPSRGRVACSTASSSWPAAASATTSSPASAATVVGYAGLMFVVGDAHVTNIAVAADRQRTGIATRLLAELAWEAIDRGCEAMTLEVRVSNTGAQALYRSFGFVPAGVRQRYYENTEDAIVMWCHDIGEADFGDRLTAAEPRVGAGCATAMNVTESTVVLGIETSCDETAAALVMGGHDVLSSVVSTQVDLHAQYGGVVPEIASRAHLDLLNPVVARAIVEAGVEPERIDAVACTVGPGLVGALLVGVSAAKALALTWDVPFVGVNHMEAHLYAAFLEDQSLELPLVVLLVSGGHTMLIEMRDHGHYRLLGQTIDDAAGEAFDKVARFLGLGYPGGPAIDQEADARRPDCDRLPAGDAQRRARLQLQRAEDVGGQPRPQEPRRVRCRRRRVVPGGGGRRARGQGPACRGLGRRTRPGARRWGRRQLPAARTVRRSRRGGRRSSVFLPSRAMCTDNAAMIAAAGWHRLGSDGPTPLDIGALPNLRLTFVD